ncbi:MAG: class F sortase [Candidatus Nomurabacteria bacterium]|nr:class F sortase [Candidatus Nomurabacteria bacterium]
MPKHDRKNRKVLWILLSILLFATVAAGVFFGLKFFLGDGQTNGEQQFQARNDLDEQVVTLEQTSAWEVAPDRPRYMSIPKIGINSARVVALGLVGSENRLDDPNNIYDVGWYMDSAGPGAVTAGKPAALYDGHNTGVNARGVFWRLGELAVGDEINIERGDGQTFRYAIAERSEPPLEQVDMSIMMKSADANIEGLNIITCAGEWTADKNTFSHRLLIRAVLTQ